MLFSRQSFLVLGLSRSGVSAGEYLLSRGAKVYLYDDVCEGAVKTALNALVQKGGFSLSKEELSTKIADCDILVLSPGIPVDHPIPVAFKRAKKRVIGEAELGILGLKCPVVAVTGTNGKTTTVTLLDEIFKKAGKESVACGNIGKPITSVCATLPETAVAVAEISSFQLETVYSIRPHVGVVLNLTEDHLNRHYNMENYAFLKARLLKNQAESEYAVLNYDDERVRAFAEKTRAKIIWFSQRAKVEGAYLFEGNLYYFDEKICDKSELSLGGAHNVYNALASIASAKIMGVESDAIRAVLSTFQGVRHRLQKVGEVNGITFINDSKATNVDATIKALDCIKGDTVLLLGGKDKGYSYDLLFEKIRHSSVVHTVVYGENAFKILDTAVKKGCTAITLCRPFDLAVRVAYLTATNGQSVLLSPASASFDQFSGYEERGEAFVSLMNTLKADYEVEGEVTPAEE